MFQSFINDLKLKLTFPLPGEDAQYEVAPASRKRMNELTSEVINYKSSAVLILLYPNENNQIQLLLIERTIDDSHHSGQIALPGGKIEEGDVDLEATALREFFEETGSDLMPTIIGKLTPLHIPVSQFVVQPYIGYVNQKPNFSISEAEVNQLIEWNIEQLLDDTIIKQTTVEPRPGLVFTTPYFEVQDKILWGATAMMLNELKWILMERR